MHSLLPPNQEQWRDKEEHIVPCNEKVYKPACEWDRS
jgi:hypothetical protein